MNKTIRKRFVNLEFLEHTNQTYITRYFNPLPFNMANLSHGTEIEITNKERITKDTIVAANNVRRQPMTQ